MDAVNYESILLSERIIREDLIQKSVFPAIQWLLLAPLKNQFTIKKVIQDAAATVDFSFLQYQKAD